MVANPGERFFEGIEGLELTSQESPYHEGESRIFAIDLLYIDGPLRVDDFPYTEYQVACSDGGYTYIAHYTPDASPSVTVQGQDFVAGYSEYGAPIRVVTRDPFYEVDEGLWQAFGESETYRMQLRGAEPNDRAYQISLEFITREDAVDKPDRDFRPGRLRYGAALETHFYSETGKIIKVFVASHITHIDGEESPFGETSNRDVRVYWDHPLVESRIQCVSDAWELVAPTVRQLQESDPYTFKAIYPGCLKPFLDRLAVPWDDRIAETQIAYCDSLPPDDRVVDGIVVSTLETGR